MLCKQENLVELVDLRSKSLFRGNGIVHKIYEPPKCWRKWKRGQNLYFDTKSFFYIILLTLLPLIHTSCYNYDKSDRYLSSLSPVGRKYNQNATPCSTALLLILLRQRGDCGSNWKQKVSYWTKFTLSIVAFIVAEKIAPLRRVQIEQ